MFDFSTPVTMFAVPDALESNLLITLRDAGGYGNRPASDSYRFDAAGARFVGLVSAGIAQVEVRKFSDPLGTYPYRRKQREVSKVCVQPDNLRRR